LERKKAQAYRDLINGQVFLKYGQYGYPKQKHVYFDGKAIRWRPNTKEGHKKIEKSTATSNKKKAINFDDGYLKIKRNREGKAFKRFKVKEE